MAHMGTWSHLAQDGLCNGRKTLSETGHIWAFLQHGSEGYIGSHGTGELGTCRNRQILGSQAEVGVRWG